MPKSFDPSIGSLRQCRLPICQRLCQLSPKGPCPAFLLGAAVLVAGLAGVAGSAKPPSASSDNNFRWFNLSALIGLFLRIEV